MFLAKSPAIVKKYYPRLIWDIPNQEQDIFLTFDDGPIPEVTPWVLDLLKHYDIKATFFCLGCNVLENQEIYDRLLEEGHAVGNHSFSHPKGWETDDEVYFTDVKKCQGLVQSGIFRPPYGRIKKSQIETLVADYKIIMWDVLSGDYDERISPEKCYQNVIKNTKAGSIIVFHDSQKAFINVKEALPRVLESLLDQGFSFKTIV